MDFSTLTVDLSAVYGLATAIVGGLVGMVSVRKVIKLVNRS